jgi:hypothetical protein
MHAASPEHLNMRVIGMQAGDCGDWAKFTKNVNFRGNCNKASETGLKKSLLRHIARSQCSTQPAA